MAPNGQNQFSSFFGQSILKLYEPIMTVYRTKQKAFYSECCMNLPQLQSLMKT